MRVRGQAVLLLLLRRAGEPHPRGAGTAIAPRSPSCSRSPIPPDSRVPEEPPHPGSRPGPARLWGAVLWCWAQRLRARCRHLRVQLLAQSLIRCSFPPGLLLGLVLHRQCCPYPGPHSLSGPRIPAREAAAPRSSNVERCWQGLSDFTTVECSLRNCCPMLPCNLLL